MVAHALGSFDVLSSRPAVCRVSMGPLCRAAAGTSSAKQPKVFGSDVAVVADRLGAYLRRLHPAKTAACVAGDTGCSQEQVEKWLQGGSLPSLMAFFRLVNAYGPQFMAEVYPGQQDWLDEAAQSERVRKLEAAIAAQQHELDLIRGRE